MKAVYPVLFTQTEDTVLIEVPDLEIITEGKDLFEAINYAKDSIELIIVTLEDDHKSVAAASDLDAIDVNEGTFLQSTVVQLNLWLRLIQIATVRLWRQVMSKKG